MSSVTNTATIDNSILLNAIPALLVLIAIETIYMMKETKQRDADLLTNLFFGITAIPLSFLIKGITLYTYSFFYDHRIFDLDVNHWQTWLICFFADDLSYYWFHRLSHKVRFLWASHMVHHSSEKFTFSSALRVPWTGNFTGNFLFWAWMPLIGIEPSMLLWLKTASVAYQFWLHTESIGKLPACIEAVFNTPSHHRVHHGSDVEYLDKNHAGTLIIWDKLFGTFQQEKHKPTYGLTENVSTLNPVTIQFHEWRNLFNDLKKSKGLKEQLNLLFNVPGWKKDGKGKTTKQLQSLSKQLN